LQDIPRVMDLDAMATLHPGELFGELSALTRTPRSATVFADGQARLIEIRWQGLRDLMRFDPQLKQHVERLYRTHSLETHLRELPLFAQLPDESLQHVVEAAEFETYGNFDWQNKFEGLRREAIAERILGEPSVAERGEYINGLILIRNGFARVCRKEENGYRTVAYLGKGQSFGWRELVHMRRTGAIVPWQLSLRAVGYLDIIRIPTSLVESHVLPHVPTDQLPAPLPTEPLSLSSGKDRRLESRAETLDTPMLEFLVEERFINGTQAMLIDLNRCTRCDDCVRACAATHDGNPRFVRQGTRHEQYLIANACMHCADPVCMIGCPTGAISRHTTEGVVTINDNTCIGCSTCANSCPYHNIQMVEVRDDRGRPYIDRERNLPIVKATKCDLCVEQLGGPACQRACPHDALIRIDLTTADPIKSFMHR
jgi:Fe-S-cluster-containing dehydrogenase component/CRP-like cAMP-binding protein